MVEILPATYITVAVQIEAIGWPATLASDHCDVRDPYTDTVLLTDHPVEERPPKSGIYLAELPVPLTSSVTRVEVAFKDAADNIVAYGYGWPGGRSATNRREVRWRVGDRLWGEERTWHEFASAAGLDWAAMPGMTIGGLEEHRGLWVWFPRQGEERRVTEFEPWVEYDPVGAPGVFAPVLRWSPPLLAPPLGDYVELYGARPSRINRAIIDAMRLCEPGLLIPAEERRVSDGETVDVRLPTDARQVVRVGLERDNGVGEWLVADAWALLPGGRLRAGGCGIGWSPFWGNVAEPTAVPLGWRTRVLLACAPPPPLDDGVRLPILPEAVVEAACVDLAMGLPELRTLLPLMEQRATVMRSRAVQAPEGGSRDVQW